MLGVAVPAVTGPSWLRLWTAVMQLLAEGVGAVTAAENRSVRTPQGLPSLALTPMPRFAAPPPPRSPLSAGQQRPSAPHSACALSPRLQVGSLQCPESLQLPGTRQRKRRGGMYMTHTHPPGKSAESRASQT